MKFASVYCSHEDIYVCECNPEASTRKKTALSISSKSDIIRTYIASREKLIQVHLHTICYRRQILIDIDCISTGKTYSHVNG